jgi:hypothetical protein
VEYAEADVVYQKKLQDAKRKRERPRYSMFSLTGRPLLHFVNYKSAIQCKMIRCKSEKGEGLMGISTDYFLDR